MAILHPQSRIVPVTLTLAELAKLGSGPNGASPKPATCSNPSNCANPDRRACEPCKECHLVQYCSETCRNGHRLTHESDCRSKLAEKAWIPDWATNNGKPAKPTSELDEDPQSEHYLWGDDPSYDLLKLEDNEGLDYDKDLELCFAASGDLRHLMTTILAVPETFNKQINVLINEHQHSVVQRNVLMLLLALSFPDGEASELILHLWYSASIPSRMYSHISDKIVPLIKLAQNVKQGKLYDEDDYPGELITKSWVMSGASLDVLLTESEWDWMLEKLEPKQPLELAVSNKRRKAVMLTPPTRYQKDVLSAALLCIPRFHRVGEQRFRETGVLLPFGTSCEEFDTVNPTLFCTSGKWLSAVEAIPVVGQDLKDLLHTGERLGVAKNDIYGAFFFQRMQMVSNFCRRLAALKIKLSMTCLPASKIHYKVPKDLRFDRIDVSNIIDDRYMNARQVLRDCMPMLKTVSANPHATLLSHVQLSLRSEVTEAEIQASVDRHGGLIRKLLDQLDQAPPKNSSAEQMLRAKATLMFVHMDSVFDRYRKFWQFAELGAQYGAEEKEINTIIAKWPHRISQNQTLAAVKGDFNLRMGYFEGTDIFVEWKRVNEER